jgi:hypothetical protein
VDECPTSGLRSVAVIWREDHHLANQTCEPTVGSLPGCAQNVASHSRKLLDRKHCCLAATPLDPPPATLSKSTIGNPNRSPRLVWRYLVSQGKPLWFAPSCADGGRGVSRDGTGYADTAGMIGSACWQRAVKASRRWRRSDGTIACCYAEFEKQQGRLQLMPNVGDDMGGLLCYIGRPLVPHQLCPRACNSTIQHGSLYYLLRPPLFRCRGATVMAWSTRLSGSCELLPPPLRAGSRGRSLASRLACLIIASSRRQRTRSFTSSSLSEPSLSLS